MRVQFGLPFEIDPSPCHKIYEGHSGIVPVFKLKRYPRYNYKRTDNDDAIGIFNTMAEHDKVWWNRNEYVLSELSPQAFVKNFLKYGGVRPIGDDWLRQLGIKAMMKEFCRPYKPLSWEELFPLLPTDSSPGFPLNTRYTRKDQFYLAHYDDLKDLSNKMQDGHPAEFIWSIALKEELRTYDKVLAHDTRTFLVGSAIHHALFSRYTIPALDWMYKNYITCGSTIGMSPFHGNWARLYDKHSLWDHIAPSTFNGDVRQQDSTYTEEDRQDQFLVDAFCLNENNIDFKTKYFNELKQLHAACGLSLCIDPEGNTVYKDHGMPSGSADTSGGNTRDVWKNLFKTFAMACKERWPTISDDEIENKFNEFIRLSCNGDDFKMTVHPSIQTWYNSDVVAINLLKLGKQLKEHVPGVTHRFVEVKDCVYLSHGFRVINDPFIGRVVVPVSQGCKLLNSLEHSSTSTSPAILLAKANNFRILAVGNDQLYNSLEEFVERLKKRYQDTYRDDKVWMEAVNSYKNHNQILMMYATRNFESGGDLVTISDQIKQVWFEVTDQDDQWNHRS